MSTSSTALTPIHILPSGHPFFGEEFQYENYAEGLLQLATTDLTKPLPPDWDFLRQVVQNYLTKLCHLPQLGNADTVVNDVPPLEPPTLWDNAMFLVNAPPINGAEYLTSDALTEWWTELDKYVRSQIKQHSAGAADWIQKQNPLWRTVGRVTFHLAENKRDEYRPFAFMATYTDMQAGQNLAANKPVQLPLNKALMQYASARDKNTLLRLLQPINTAAEKCDWVQEMIDDQTVYQPRAWTPKQAYKLLQDIPALEESGLIVR
ncbi:MAG: hypothetical protein LBN39_10560, partial [Planctomycetaceae bacterium]|nr:hypothetical protein [Planctomycetaceae bacterium]